jgi:hypothetical protein
MSETLPSAEALQQPWVAEPVSVKKKASYAPLFETLRLYAGWVLFWASVLLVIMAYGETRHLPYRIPYIQDIAQIRSIVVVACSAFLFLLVSRIHRLFRGGAALGAALGILWILGLVFVMQNI